jgi:hypothetical protein
MSETTQIHPDKVRAYLATDYRLGHTAQDIVLTIGQCSERLAALFAANGVKCGGFLTAYNPRGTIQSDAANERAHAQLAGLLREQDCSRSAASCAAPSSSRTRPGGPPCADSPRSGSGSFGGKDGRGFGSSIRRQNQAPERARLGVVISESATVPALRLILRVLRVPLWRRVARVLPFVSSIESDFRGWGVSVARRWPCQYPDGAGMS